MSENRPPAESQVIFAVAPSEDGPPMMTFFMTPTSFQWMQKTGQCHQFDLTEIGLPIRAAIIFAKNRADALAQVHAHNEALGRQVKDLTQIDVGFDRNDKKVKQ
jgi:hypothetical protein